MGKGRPVTAGIDAAVAIARKRGCVMRIVHGLESISDLIIRTASHVAFIRIRRTEKITATVREIEYRYRNLIAELHLFPASAQILPELWIYSKHGTYRFFRIHGTGLVELDRDGIPAQRPETTGDPETSGGTEVIWDPGTLPSPEGRGIPSSQGVSVVKEGGAAPVPPASGPRNSPTENPGADRDQVRNIPHPGE